MRFGPFIQFQEIQNAASLKRSVFAAASHYMSAQVKLPGSVSGGVAGGLQQGGAAGRKDFGTVVS
jgi:hypothetical protein